MSWCAISSERHNYLPEDGSVSLHCLLHVQPNLGSGQRTAGIPNLVKLVNRLLAELGVHRFVRSVRGKSFFNVVGACTAKDDNVEQRVGTESVSTVDRDTGGFTGSIKTGNDFVVALLVDGEDFTGVLGGNTAHAVNLVSESQRKFKRDGSLVVDSRQNWDRLLGNIDTGKDSSSFRDTGQSLVQYLGGQVAKLKEDVVLFGTDASTFSDFEGHGSGNDISGGKVLGSRGVSFHESLTLRVDEVTTLTSRTYLMSEYRTTGRRRNVPSVIRQPAP